MMRTVAVIPVRMGSERLPGKVMASIEGQPLLGHLLDRVQRCTVLDDVVVATSTNSENDCIETYCNQQRISVFRGDEEDVLDRLLQALLWCGADTGVLIFGDGPLIDRQIISKAVSFFYANPGYDLVSNDLLTTWPPGMEVEVFKVEVLADAAGRCQDPQIREHGTLFIRQHTEIYRLYNLVAPEELNRPDLSFEVDVAEDVQVIEALLKRFQYEPDVPLNELIHYMDKHPHLSALTSKVERRWKRHRQTNEAQQ